VLTQKIVNKFCATRMQGSN